jgi:hypothetical protein
MFTENQSPTAELHRILRLLARKQAIEVNYQDSRSKSATVAKRWDIKPNPEFLGDWEGNDSLHEIYVNLLDIYQAKSLALEERWLFDDLIAAIEELAIAREKDLI